MTPRLPEIVHTLGRRNVAYVLFTLALVPLAAALNGAGMPGSRGSPGTLFAVLSWAAVSVPFVPVNLVLLVRDLVSHREDKRPLQALLACALPFVVAAAAG